MDKNELKRVGLKVTLPRMKVLSILENAHERHMSAEEVYKALLDANEDVSLATVYRVLTQFEEAGLVNRSHFEAESAVYEINEGEHHDHLVCIKCSKVEEFVDQIIEKRQIEIARNANFKMIEHSFTIYGICENCSEK